MKNIFNIIFYSLFGLIVLGLTLLFVAPPLPYVGSLDVKIVKSGSMEPEIMTGAVVFVREAPDYNINDVITFTDANAKIPTTHRIVGTEEVGGVDYFITKGDANEERDTNLVASKNVLGKVVLDLPYVGFVLDYARQPVGFALLVGIPALLIVLEEVSKIWVEVRRMRGVKITREMIAPLVITPYKPARETENTRESFLETVSERKMLDIRPIRKVEKKLEPTPKSRTKSQYRMQMYHDIKPKMSVLASLVVMVFMAGQIWGGDVTLSYPTDKEISNTNSMKAVAVDFSMEPNSTTFKFDKNGSKQEVQIGFEKDSSLDMVFAVKVVEVKGDSVFCNDILLETESPFTFSSALSSLSQTEVYFNNLWELGFSLSKPHDEGEVCTIKMETVGYLDGLDDQSGYVDTETLVFVFEAKEKILPMLPLLNTENTILSAVGVSNEEETESEDTASETESQTTTQEEEVEEIVEDKEEETVLETDENQEDNQNQAEETEENKEEVSGEVMIEENEEEKSKETEEASTEDDESVG